MVTNVTKNNYRKFYEEQTRTLLPRGFHVHHIDLNRDNNILTNLVALPTILHKKVHKYMPPDDWITWNLEGSQYTSRTIYCLDLMNRFFPIYIEACRWVDYRNYLLGLFPNVHNLSYNIDYEHNKD